MGGAHGMIATKKYKGIKRWYKAIVDVFQDKVNELDKSQSNINAIESVNKYSLSFYKIEKVINF